MSSRPVHVLEKICKLVPGVQLLPPAEASEIAKLETAFGHEISGQLKDAYALYNGEDLKCSSAGVFFGLGWLSVGGVIDQIESWSQTRAEVGSQLDEYNTSSPVGAIRSVYSHEGWLPFAQDWGGNFLAIDMAPGPAGVAGQIINMGRDEERKFVLARSFEAFIEWIDKAIAARQYKIEDGAFEYAGSDHFIDTARSLVEQGVLPGLGAK